MDNLDVDAGALCEEVLVLDYFSDLPDVRRSSKAVTRTGFVRG